MAMAPKKKFDFFNGGRGVNLNDIYMEENEPPTPPPILPPPVNHDHEEEMSQDPYIHGDWGRYSTSRGLLIGRSSSSPPPLLQEHSSHPDYLHGYSESSLSGNQSPTGYSDHSQSGYHSPNGYSPHSPVGMSGIGHSAPPEGILSQESSLPWGTNSIDDEDARKKKKRHQRCRLCANHGVYVEVKGHKWYCPYRESHNCDKCEITRKRQYYMAEQQKLTREQQQVQVQQSRCNNNRGIGCSSSSNSSSSGCSNGGSSLPDVSTVVGGNSGSIHSSKTHPRDFPRLDELVRETANIINEDLFDMINQVVRPRAKQ